MTVADVFQIAALVAAVVGVRLFLAPFIGDEAANGAALLALGAVLWLTGRELDTYHAREAEAQARIEAIRAGRASDLLPEG